MDINEIFKKTDTNIGEMLSELVETQCAVKGLLLAVVNELADGDEDKATEILANADKLREQELLRVVARFA